MSLSLIITFAFLINANLAGAQTFDTMLLLEGQTASSSTSATTPAAFHSIWVTSIGNSTLSATLNGPSGESGVAWVMLFGTGGANWGDFAFGPVPNSGIKATIQIGQGLSFSIVMGGILLTTPVSVEDSVKYSINVAR